MGIIDDVKDLFSDTATWAALTGRDQYGTPTYGSGTAFTARLVRKNSLVRDRQGQEVTSRAHLWLAGSPAIDTDDKITLSDSTVPVIVSVERYQDEHGATHTKVFFL